MARHLLMFVAFLLATLFFEPSSLQLIPCSFQEFVIADLLKTVVFERSQHYHSQFEILHIRRENEQLKRTNRLLHAQYVILQETSHIFINEINAKLIHKINEGTQNPPPLLNDRQLELIGNIPNDCKSKFQHLEQVEIFCHDNISLPNSKNTFENIKNNINECFTNIKFNFIPLKMVNDEDLIDNLNKQINDLNIANEIKLNLIKNLEKENEELKLKLETNNCLKNGGSDQNYLPPVEPSNVDLSNMCSSYVEKKVRESKDLEENYNNQLQICVNNITKLNLKIEQLEDKNTNLNPQCTLENIEYNETILNSGTDCLNEQNTLKNITLKYFDNKLNCALNLSQQNPEDLLKITKLVVNIREELLGIGHPDTLISKISLANLLNDLNQTEKSLDIINDVLQIEINSLGTNHINTLSTLSMKAYILMNLGNYNESLIINKDILMKKLGNLRNESSIRGDGHKDTIRTLMNIAEILSLNADGYNEALTYHHMILGIQKRVLGNNHSDLLKTMQKIGVIIRKIYNSYKE